MAILDGNAVQTPTFRRIAATIGVFPAGFRLARPGFHASTTKLMLDNDPVTLWIDELRGGEEAAAGKLWKHFVDRLYESARGKLRPKTRRVYDEEDAALSAFRSVCAGISAGRFPDLGDRELVETDAGDYGAQGGSSPSA